MNKKHSFFRVTFFLISTGFLISAGALFAVELSEAAKPQKPQNIVVSLKPYALLVENIKREGDLVSILVEDGVTAHDFQLRPSHIKKIAEADLVIWSGEAAEPSLAKALKHKKNQLVLLDVASLDLIYTEHAHDQTDHQHSIDSHIWFSKHNALVIAKTIAEALSYADETINEINKSFAMLQTNEDVEQPTTNHAALVVYHNAYAYLEKELNIKHDFVINENHNAKPSLRHWHAFKEKLEKYQKQNKALCVVTLSGFENSSEAKQLKVLLANSGMTTQTKLVEIDPLASSESYRDYVEFYLDSKKRLLDCLQYSL